MASSVEHAIARPWSSCDHLREAGGLYHIKSSFVFSVWFYPGHSIPYSHAHLLCKNSRYRSSAPKIQALVAAIHSMWNMLGACLCWVCFTLADLLLSPPLESVRLCCYSFGTWTELATSSCLYCCSILYW